MDFIDRLRQKWATVPFSADDRSSSHDLLAMSDAEFDAAWETARRTTSEGPVGFGIRGWYQLLYGDWVRGRNILDIGAGLGIDSVHYAQCGAHVTFVDLVPANIAAVKRICAIKAITDARFLVMSDVADLDTLGTDYDAVFAFGSLLHAPQPFVKSEVDALVRRLKRGGRFIMHAYPKSRWQREGALPFDAWGEKTDGPGTPWAEWYDTDKLLRLLRPARFEPVMYCEYRQGDMNCIDLMHVAGDPAFADRQLPESARLVEGATGLAAVRVHPHWHPARLETTESAVTITTAPAPWAFAAEILVDRSALRSTGPFYLRADLQVEQGEVGVGALHASDDRFIVERRFSAEGDVVSAVLEIPSLDDVRHLIVHNTNRDNTPSVVTFRALALYENADSARRVEGG